MKYKIHNKVTKYKIQNSKCIYSTKYKIQHAKYTKYEIQYPKRKIQNTSDGDRRGLQGVSACDEVHFKWHCPV